MAWLGGLADLASDLKAKKDMEEASLEPERKSKTEKLDSEIVERLQQSCNLNESEIQARYEEFNKMFPEKKGTRTIGY